ncbi:MAG: glycosyltransferase family 2 protein [Thermodesulfobacteriota bacterium]
MSQERPLVSLIVIHYGETRLLGACLSSLKFIKYPSVEVLIISNSPRDAELTALMTKHPDNKFIFSKTNLGYAGGCNKGIELASGKYLFILNNDVVLDSDCLSPLVRASELDREIALAQPKILSITEKNRFEYSGAAGGLIDHLGYPFAAGRIFNDVEYNKAQYEQTTEIFWASGAALFARKSVIIEAGSMDADFFAYMEEIDLAWRVHLLGYKIIYVPEARIFHLGSAGMDRKSLNHLYLNHRNNLVMVLKNYSAATLLRVLPQRIILEAATMAYALFKENPLRAKAIAKAALNVTTNILSILRERKKVQAKRVVHDREIQKKMYQGSIAVEYFLKKRKTLKEIPGVQQTPYFLLEKRK